MNKPTPFTAPETFALTHDGERITGRVLERSVRRLHVQLDQPFGLLHCARRVHPSVGGALGYAGTAGDYFKEETLLFLYRRAQILQYNLPRIGSLIRAEPALADLALRLLDPVIGRYAPFNAHSFLLATHALQLQPVQLPPLTGDPLLSRLLGDEDVKALLFQDLTARSI